MVSLLFIISLKTMRLTISPSLSLFLSFEFVSHPPSVDSFCLTVHPSPFHLTLTDVYHSAALSRVDEAD